MERKSFKFEDLSLSYLEAGSASNPTIVINHANGFSAGCYDYFARPLSDRYRVLSLDFAGHGTSDTRLEFDDWSFFADQVIALLDHAGVDEAIGIGHSMGGTSQLLASYDSPGRLSKVIALDPVILGYLRIGFMRLFGNPLAKRAFKRRNIFKSPQSIYRAYRKHPMFVQWEEEIFKDYVTTCFKPQGDQFTLACDPRVEGGIFNGVRTSKLKALYSARTEAHLVLPEKSAVCPRGLGKKVVKGALPGSTLTKQPDMGHMFPFERAAWTLNVIEELLSS